jgi:site-specific DNA-methyltransferase (adenine-specific)
LKPYYKKSGIIIYNADFRDVIPDLSDDAADLIFADPPYGVGVDYDKYDDDPEKTTKMVLNSINVLKRVGKITAIMAGRYETEIALYRSNPPRWKMIWYKGAQSSKSPIGFNDYETILIYGNKINRNAHDHITARPEKRQPHGHPCPKPLKLLTTMIRRLTKTNQLVIDPFCGSGTTLVAAKILGRTAIGMDISEKYCEQAANRLEDQRQNIITELNPSRDLDNDDDIDDDEDYYGDDIDDDFEDDDDDDVLDGFEDDDDDLDLI